jgi:hypothetical protein
MPICSATNLDVFWCPLLTQSPSNPASGGGECARERHPLATRLTARWLPGLPQSGCHEAATPHRQFLRRDLVPANREQGQAATGRRAGGAARRCVQRGQGPAPHLRGEALGAKPKSRRLEVPTVADCPPGRRGGSGAMAQGESIRACCFGHSERPRRTRIACARELPVDDGGRVRSSSSAGLGRRGRP